MALLGKAKARAQSLVVFEISTSSVSASLGVHDTHSTRLLWSKRLEYSFERTDEYTHYTKSMYAALLEVGMALLNDGVRIAQHDPAFLIRHAQVHCVLSPPWFFAAVRSASRTYEKRRQVTHGMQDELKGQLCNEVLQLPEYVAWNAVSGIGEIMEQYDLARYVDGYHIVGEREYVALEYSATTYLSFAPSDVLRQIEEIIRKVLPNHTSQLHSSTYLLSQYRRQESGTGAYRECLIEVGGQVTSVSVVEHGIMRGVSTLPLGSHDLLRACAPKAVRFEEAESIAKEQVSAPPEDIGALPDTVVSMLGEWNDRVHEALVNASRGVTLPPTAALWIRDTWYPIFARTLGSAWEQPGIREARALAVVPCDAAPQEGAGDAALGTVSDRRSYTLLHTIALGLGG